VTLINLALSFTAAGSVSMLALRVRALAPSGFVAATIVGGVITACGGWQWGVLLLAFFVSSSALSRITHRRRPDQGLDTVRGARRDAWQVLANGGVALACALLWWLTGRDWLITAFAASLTAAAADTWATEIGAFSRHRPRSITTMRPVERGVSGGVSPLGTAAALLGALLMAMFAAFLLDHPNATRTEAIIGVGIAGFAGCLIDSLLGATLQVQFRCPKCNLFTERRTHRCGTATHYARGVAWLNNDVVNISAILAGALIGALFVAI